MPPSAAEDKENLLLILPSNRMTLNGEDNSVRISKRARTKYGLGNKLALDFATVHSVSEQKSLEVKKVYSEDLSVLSKHPSFFELTNNIGFVSTANFNALIDDDAKTDVFAEEIDVTLGTDPEFGLKPKGSAHCKMSNSILSKDTKLKRFGEDGPCAEVRPIPSTNVDTLVKNTEAAFRQGLDTPAKDYMWLGGVTQPGEPNDRVFQIGGHVHIGNPNSTDGLDYISFTPLLVKLLDEKLAVPIALCEGEEGYKRRTLTYHGQVYGNWGDYRLKPKGSNPKRFEWRTASGAWVLSPSFYRCTLYLVKKLSDGFYRILSEMARNTDGELDENGIYKFKEFINKRVCVLSLPSDEAYKKFVQTIGSDRGSVESQVKTIIESLKSSADLFAIDKSMIDMFIAYCKSTLDEINKTRDLKDTWIEKKKEHVVGKNILDTLKVVEPSKTKKFKLIKVG